ncbi:MBL fold metallo-hydrolase [Chloroflexota bacterium]
MIITCWGSRGSIPVSGSEYVRYGGSTTCMEVRTKDDDIIIVDAGSGIRKLGNRLLNEERYEYSIVFTHSHWDHILGFPFFKPIYVEGTRIDIYGYDFAQESISDMISRTMVRPNFPVNLDDVKSEFSYHAECENSFQIGSVTVTPILLSHPNKGIGYKFIEEGKVFVFLTDNELTYKHPGGMDYGDYLRVSTGADVLIHDAEYTAEEYKTTRTWGHSVYSDALRLALEAGVKQFGLFHHNQERTDIELDHIVQDCRHIVQAENARLECFAVHEGMVIDL